MKKAVFILLYIVGVFLILAMFILPEYRLRVVSTFVIYAIFFIFILIRTANIELKHLYDKLKSKKAKFLFIGLSLSSIFIIIAYSVLNMPIFGRVSLDLSKSKEYSVLKGLNKINSNNDTIEVVYVRAVNKEDNKAYFSSLLNDIKSYLPQINFKVVHPVTDALDFAKLKDKLPSASSGSVIVSNGKNYVLAEKLTAQGIVHAINRVYNGDIYVCYEAGHGTPNLNDFSETGSALLYNMLADRGIVLVPVESNYWEQCPVLFFTDPSVDINKEEIKKLTDYNGVLIIFGGMNLPSFRNLIFSKGIAISEKNINTFKEYSFRDYSGSLILESFSEHPINKNIGGSVVVSHAYELTCSDCFPLASIDEKTVYMGKNNLLLFSGSRIATNYFMRFNGNLRFIYNALSYSYSPNDYGEFVDINEDFNFLVISPRYLELIFWICIVGVPVAFLFIGLYCIRGHRTIRALTAKRSVEEKKS